MTGNYFLPSNGIELGFFFQVSELSLPNPEQFGGTGGYCFEIGQLSSHLFSFGCLAPENERGIVVPRWQTWLENEAIQRIIRFFELFGRKNLGFFQLKRRFKTTQSYTYE